jgi:hypothetical protein
MRALTKTYLLVAIASCALACDEPEYDESPVAYPEPEEETPPPPSSIVREATAARPEDRPRQIEPAASPDFAYTEPSLEPVRRLVYRFTMRFIGGAERDTTLALPGGELTLDVTADRLRATFAGAGWPVPQGAQVRMRREWSGAYVFDDTRGRPLGVGALSVWFSGGRAADSVELGVRRAVSGEDPHVTLMICRFLAELAALPVDRTARRCAEDGMPTLLRLGPYLVDRTADVGVIIPRAAMRADEVDPPPPIYAVPNTPFLSPEELGRLVPGTEVPERDPHGLEPPARGLRVENRSDARVLVTVDDTPIGYLDANAEQVYEGLAEGSYTVGALRPLGGRRLRPHLVVLPAHVRFGPSVPSVR